MRQDEAQRLVAKLFAAYDRPREKLTAAVYIEAFVRLDQADAQRAVDELIASEKWMPTVAQVNEVCARLREAAAQARSARALQEPPVSDEQRAENLERLKHLQERLFRPVPEGEAPCDCLLCTGVNA